MSSVVGAYWIPEDLSGSSGRSPYSDRVQIEFVSDLGQLERLAQPGAPAGQLIYVEDSTTPEDAVQLVDSVLPPMPPEFPAEFYRRITVPDGSSGSRFPTLSLHGTPVFSGDLEELIRLARSLGEVRATPGSAVYHDIRNDYQGSVDMMAAEGCIVMPGRPAYTIAHRPSSVHARDGRKAKLSQFSREHKRLASARAEAASRLGWLVWWMFDPLMNPDVLDRYVNEDEYSEIFAPAEFQRNTSLLQSSSQDEALLELFRGDITPKSSALSRGADGGWASVNSARVLLRVVFRLSGRDDWRSYGPLLESLRRWRRARAGFIRIHMQSVLLGHYAEKLSRSHNLRGRRSRHYRSCDREWDGERLTTVGERLSVGRLSAKDSLVLSIPGSDRRFTVNVDRHSVVEFFDPLLEVCRARLHLDGWWPKRAVPKSADKAQEDA